MQKYVNFLKRVKEHNNKKMIIWGGAGINAKMIRKALLFGGYDVAYMVDSRIDEAQAIYAPERLENEDKSGVLVIVSPQHIPYILEIDATLERYGYQKDINYINYSLDEEINQNLNENFFDPFLGYSQIYDLEGFQCYGRDDSENRIVVLGNCTSLHKDSWVKDIAEKLNHMFNGDYVLYNGACAGYSTSQELIKTIRDVILLRPNILIAVNGVIDAISNSIEGHPFVTRFEHNILEHHTDMGKEGVKYKGMQDVPNHILYGLPDEGNRYQCYVKNVRLMHAVAQEFNIIFCNVLQPSIYYEGKKNLLSIEKQLFEEFYESDDDELTAKYNAANNFYVNVKRELAGFEWFIDMTEVFKCSLGKSLRK